MVLLDCEVAWYGDPVFDAAFLLNHLLLKALYHAPHDAGLASMVQAFWKYYISTVRDAFDSATLEPPGDTAAVDAYAGPGRWQIARGIFE